MFVPTFSSAFRRLSKPHKYSAAGLAAVGVASLAFAAVPGQADAGQSAQALSAKPVALQASGQGAQAQKAALVHQTSFAVKKADSGVDQKKDAGKKADKKVLADGAKKANETASAKPKAQPKKYEDNLDGWIREAMDIMKKEGIPGSYEGIHRNIIRESGGNPNIANTWDINAQNGTPSIGLLQVIQPTFDAYHVKGTKHDLKDPVANIVAACNYAADRYGSMDNVNSAY
ncbi:transglycosylase SLT domain-containing protein [Streptomyces sp. TP-A0874]|uniref:transglycosylase SLT domain-containing protein n=1 Tax=Streptomyces sp. TP-A0874 TaxID=549819 RepID=UPI000852FFDF|nr:transglycosylase SLT domain-containing protein [Streptomyces sp. TP-A0874]